MEAMRIKNNQEGQPMIDPRDLNFILNFKVDPKIVARHYHKRLGKYEDWQVLALPSWGQIAWDYEEGIKFRVNGDVASLEACRWWTKRFMLDLEATGKYGHIVLMGDWLSGTMNYPFSDEAHDLWVQTGWIVDKEFDFVWHADLSK
jgi:hypothetical protein